MSAHKEVDMTATATNTTDRAYTRDDDMRRLLAVAQVRRYARQKFQDAGRRAALEIIRRPIEMDTKESTR